MKTAMGGEGDVIFATYRYDHHSRYSGYDLVGETIPGVRVVPPLKAFRRVVGRFHASVISRFRPTESYALMGFQSELAVLLGLLGSNRKIIHIPHGENQYWLTGFLPRIRGRRIVVTFHQPPKILEETFMSTRYLSRIDRIIVMSRSQLEFFEKLVDADRISFVPHGVDTTFFSPVRRELETGRRLQCLVVGSWLRDFQTLAHSMEIMSAWPNPPRFTLVGASGNPEAARLPGDPKILPRIDDDELRRCYRESDLVVLPMKDATANNALLESLACGCPVLVSDVGGIRDYVDEECAVLLPPGDPEALARAVWELESKPDELNRLGDAARQHSLAFDWGRVGVLMKEVYTSTLLMRPARIRSRG